MRKNVIGAQQIMKNNLIKEQWLVHGFNLYKLVHGLYLTV